MAGDMVVDERMVLFSSPANACLPGLSSPDRAEQGTVALLLQGLDGLVGQGDAILLELVETSIEVNERKVQTKALGQGLEHFPSSRDDLTADTVTGEQT